MRAFLPAPWKAVKAPGEDRIQIVCAEQVIAEVHGGNHETDAANAAMMVASPTMAGALLLVREYLREGDGAVLWEAALDAVNVALAEAGVPDDG